MAGGRRCEAGWRPSRSRSKSPSALAHSSAAVVAAYQREQLIEFRRPIMECWAIYLSGEDQTAEVIPLAGRRG